LPLGFVADATLVALNRRAGCVLDVLLRFATLRLRTLCSIAARAQFVK
jgi:hypothetical protein